MNSLERWRASLPPPVRNPQVDQVRGGDVGLGISNQQRERWCIQCQLHMVQVDGGVCPCCWGPS